MSQASMLTYMLAAMLTLHARRPTSGRYAFRACCRPNARSHDGGVYDGMRAAGCSTMVGLPHGVARQNPIPHAICCRFPVGKLGALRAFTEIPVSQLC